VTIRKEVLLAGQTTKHRSLRKNMGRNL